MHRRARRERGSLRGTLIRLSGGLAVVLGLLILTSVAGTIIATRDYRDTGLRAERRQTAANQILIDLLDAETGNRGYVLTAGGDYLRPYTQARKRYPGDLARLYELVRGEAELERSADAVDARAQLWFSEAVELIRRGDFGTMVAFDPPDIVARRLEEVVGKRKTVPPNSDLLLTAKALGVTFGD